MNPHDLSASELMIWGLVLHLLADWIFQNDWMSNNKMDRRKDLLSHWWDRHPAAYVHAGIHGVLFLFIFGWVAIPLALVHLVIDTRWPVVQWAKLIGQTPSTIFMVRKPGTPDHVALMDIGTIVRIWTDQVFHIACVAIAALAVA